MSLLNYSDSESDSEEPNSSFGIDLTPSVPLPSSTSPAKSITSKPNPSASLFGAGKNDGGLSKSGGLFSSLPKPASASSKSGGLFSSLPAPGKAKRSAPSLFSALPDPKESAQSSKGERFKSDTKPVDLGPVTIKDGDSDSDTEESNPVYAEPSKAKVAQSEQEQELADGFAVPMPAAKSHSESDEEDEDAKEPTPKRQRTSLAARVRRARALEALRSQQPTVSSTIVQKKAEVKVVMLSAADTPVHATEFAAPLLEPEDVERATEDTEQKMKRLQGERKKASEPREKEAKVHDAVNWAPDQRELELRRKQRRITASVKAYSSTAGVVSRPSLPSAVARQKNQIGSIAFNAQQRLLELEYGKTKSTGRSKRARQRYGW
ncbi:MAG: hypothetical protein MHM6MM_002597 [Cercozoa sp. M6MM]